MKHFSALTTYTINLTVFEALESTIRGHFDRLNNRRLMTLALKTFCGLIFLSVFLSCASKPSFSGKGDLCGMIIDEENRPVKEYVMHCAKNGMTVASVVTGENGMFVFENLECGNYMLSGEKKDFTSLSRQQFLFNERSKIFCAQIKSADAALDSVNQLIAAENYDRALAVLNEIYTEKKSFSEAVCSFYRVYLDGILLKQNDAQSRQSVKKSFSKELEKLKKNNFCREYFMETLKKLEEEFNENV